MKYTLIDKHQCGSCGRNKDILTVMYTNDPTGKKISSITCSGVTEDNNALVNRDVLEFIDDVEGFKNIRLLSFCYRNKETSVKPKLIIVNDCCGNKGIITFCIDRYLSITEGGGINHNIIPGMKLRVYPSHSVWFPCGSVNEKQMPDLPGY